MPASCHAQRRCLLDKSTRYDLTKTARTDAFFRFVCQAMQQNPSPTWGDIFRGRNGIHSLALAGGTALHATNVYLVTTIMPSVVQDIGGLTYYAMNTTMFIMTSIIGAVIAGHLAQRFGGKRTYIGALLLFAIAALICATAPTMRVLILGRTLEGLAGGVLVSMAYILIPHAFEERLWPRAIGMISAMWGIATLSGPAIGGIFAEYSTWRWAFWSLQPAVLILAIVVLLWLPSGSKQRDPQTPLPLPRLTLLSFSVLALSVAGIIYIPWQQATLVAAGCMALALIVHFDRRASSKLLPTGAYAPTQLRAIYITMSLLAAVSTVEVYIPFFLQKLHGYTPLQAGYLTSVMAGGWSLGSILSSSFNEKLGRKSVRFGPLLMSLSLLSFAWVVQQQTGFDQGLGFLFFLLNLLGIGMGIGTAWPHLLTYLLHSAPKEEGALASSSISTVQMYAMAVGSAFAGLIVNTAGVGQNESTEVILRASFWLFFLFGILVFLGVFSARRAVQPTAVSPSSMAS